MTDVAAALRVAVRRGTVVTVASPGVYSGKPRPAVVVQADRWLQAHPSVTLCPLTSTLMEAPLLRILVTPSPGNGLLKPSQLISGCSGIQTPSFRTAFPEPPHNP